MLAENCWHNIKIRFCSNQHIIPEWVTLPLCCADDKRQYEVTCWIDKNHPTCTVLGFFWWNFTFQFFKILPMYKQRNWKYLHEFLSVFSNSFKLHCSYFRLTFDLFEPWWMRLGADSCAVEYFSFLYSIYVHLPD